MPNYTCNDTSFFDIFSFHNIMHDAIDGGIIYEGIDILRDIPELGLVKDSSYDQVNFLFHSKELDCPILYFITWGVATSNGVVNPIPELSRQVKLSDIASFCKW